MSLKKQQAMIVTRTSYELGVLLGHTTVADLLADLRQMPPAAKLKDYSEVEGESGRLNLIFEEEVA